MSEPANNKRLLVIDDNESIHNDFRKMLCISSESDGFSELEEKLLGETRKPVATVCFELDSAMQGREGLAMVEKALAGNRPYAVAFVDMRMPPGWDGLETIEHLWRADPDLQVVICSAYSDYSWEQIVERLGMSDQLVILQKPFDRAEATQLATALTQKWWATREARKHVDDLERHRAHLGGILEDSLNEIYMLDAGTLRFINVNRGARKNLGYNEDELKRMSLPDITPAYNAERLKRLLQPLRDNDGKQVSFSAEHRRKDGTTYQVKVHLQRASLPERDVYVAIVLDVTEQVRAEEQLRHMALHDQLTGQPNRLSLINDLKKLIEQPNEAGKDFALQFLDFDRFKVINDSLGHHQGDRLLTKIARRLDETLDARSEKAYRLGGDEFVLVMAPCPTIEHAERLAERVLQAMASSYELNGHEIHLTVSIGIVKSAGRYAEPAELLRDADAAMYRAKSAGKNRYVVFDPSHHESALQRLEIETKLRKALSDGILELYYQPLFSLITGRLTGFEALARWTDPESGPISPSLFIPIAEETDLILPLGDWALRTAVNQLRNWQTRFPDYQDLSISVNLSRHQLLQTEIAQLATSIARNAGVEPSSVKLEVTESTIMSDKKSSMAALAALREAGFKLSMDDFGTGHSSLSCLSSFPLDELKIDRGFINAMTKERAFTAIVQAIVVLAHNMDICVVAEGVETQDQLLQLQTMECDIGQGFYFAKPMPAAEAERWMKENASRAA